MTDDADAFVFGARKIIRKCRDSYTRFSVLPSGSKRACLAQAVCMIFAVILRFVWSKSPEDAGYALPLLLATRKRGGMIQRTYEAYSYE